MGHVRDLPASAAEIPRSTRAAVGAPRRAGRRRLRAALRRLAEEARGGAQAPLGPEAGRRARDRDGRGPRGREHRLAPGRRCSPKVPVRRMVFHEITEEAIERALERPATSTQPGRRAGDAEGARPPGRLHDLAAAVEEDRARLSAGRVQSVAVRCWCCASRSGCASTRPLLGPGRHPGTAEDRLRGAAHPRRRRRVSPAAATSTRRTGRLKDGLTPGRGRTCTSTKPARGARRSAPGRRLAGREVESRDATRQPAPPFTTSTLQQEASRKLGPRRARHHARRAGPVRARLHHLHAHRLHDAVEEALEAARGRDRGPLRRVPPRRRARYAKRAATPRRRTRPSGPPAPSMPTAEEHGLKGDRRGAVRPDLEAHRREPDARREAPLRDRAHRARRSAGHARHASARRAAPPCSRASSAPTSRAATTPTPPRRAGAAAAGARAGAGARARGGDAAGSRDEAPGALHRGLAGEAARAGGHRPPEHLRQHHRHHPASPVRPQAGHAAHPDLRRVRDQRGARAPVRVELVDTEFTATMEATLDEIAAGSVESASPTCARSTAASGPRGHRRKGLEGIDAREISTIRDEAWDPSWCASAATDRTSREIDGEVKTASLPDDAAPADLTRDDLERILREGNAGDHVLGTFPDSGEPMLLVARALRALPAARRGRQRRPAQARVAAAGDDPGSRRREAGAAVVVAAAAARHASRLRRAVEAGIGRFGPFVRHQKTFASIPKDEDVLTVTLERALELFAKKRARNQPLRVLGEHPETGDPVEVKSGKFGPYVSAGTVNASLKDEHDVDGIDLDTALALLREREANGGGASRRGAKRAAGGRGAARGAPKKKGRAKRTGGGASRRRSRRPRAGPRPRRPTSSRTWTSSSPSPARSSSGSRAWRVAPSRPW
jgi:DNA topoisomerase I